MRPLLLIKSRILPDPRSQCTQLRIWDSGFRFRHSDFASHCCLRFATWIIDLFPLSWILNQEERRSCDDNASDLPVAFAVLKLMSTGCLQDFMNDMATKQLSVVNLDALIPNDSSHRLLRTILLTLTPSINMSSLWFNNFKSSELCEILLEWLVKNNTLLKLYLMGSNMDEKYRLKIEDAWRKRLFGHRVETYGFSFFRFNIESDTTKYSNLRDIENWHGLPRSSS